MTPPLPETFADGVREVAFDGQTVRVQLSGGNTVSHLVLPVNAAVELAGKLRQVMNAFATQTLQRQARAAQAKAGGAV